MRRRAFASLSFLALSLGLGTTSCLSTSEEVDTLRTVDDLVGRIERLHSEAELAKTRSRDALDSLAGLAIGGFQGDPVDAFEDLVEAVELSEEQAEVLRDGVEPMHETAEEVFGRWKADAGTLHIASLRQRSLARLGETRERYDAVLVSLDAAVKAYDTFNVGLRDHTTFLEHDFNASSVAAIRPEIERLTRWREELVRRLDRCMDAAARYVSASALPGGDEIAKASRN